MKAIFFVALLVFGACAAKELSNSKPNDVNSSERPIDLEAILGDKERLRTIINCFLGDSKCDTELLTLLKDSYPNTIANTCEKCTDKEKHALRRFLEESEKTHPDLLQALKKKTDPENKYYDALSKIIANY